MKWGQLLGKAILVAAVASVGLVPLEAHDPSGHGHPGHPNGGAPPLLRFARGSRILQYYVHPAAIPLSTRGPVQASVVQSMCERQLPLGDAAFRLRPRLVTRLRLAMQNLRLGQVQVHARGPLANKLEVFDFDLFYGNLPIVNSSRTVLMHDGRTMAIRDRNPPGRLARPIFPRQTAHPQAAWSVAAANSRAALSSLYPGKTPRLTADARDPAARLVLWPDEQARKLHLAWALTLRSASRSQPYLRRYWLSATDPVHILDYEDLIFYDQDPYPMPRRQPKPAFNPFGWQRYSATADHRSQVKIIDWPIQTAAAPTRLAATANAASASIVLPGSVSGTVTGLMWETSPYSQVVSRPLPGLEVTVTRPGGFTSLATTDAAGNYSLAGVSGLSTVRATLDGRACKIINDAKSEDTPTFSNRGRGVMDVTFFDGSMSEARLAQTSAYYSVTQANDFVKEYLPDRPTKLPRMKTHVNVDSSCNAYYDRSDNTLNFFRSGGDDKSCPNTAYHDVVFHEYGHAVDDELGGILDGAYSEGFGDALAMLMTHVSYVGQDFYGPGKHLRDARKVVLWPKAKDGEIHEAGQTYSGFCWELIQRLQMKYAQDKAYEVAKQLIMGAAVQNPKDIPDAVRLSFYMDAQLYPGPRGGQSLHAAQLRAAARSRQLPVPTDSANLSSPVASY